METFNHHRTRNEMMKIIQMEMDEAQTESLNQATHETILKVLQFDTYEEMEF